jgi:hypothetical protein
LRVFDRFFAFVGRFWGIFERFTLSQKTQISQILINIKIKHGFHAIALGLTHERIENQSFIGYTGFTFGSFTGPDGGQCD